MTSGITHDSGIHTMSSRRDSGMCDMKPYDMHSYRKANSDCMPVTQANFNRGASTHSLDKLANQIQYCDFNYLDNNNLLKSNTELSVFDRPTGSMHDLKTSLDAEIRYNQHGDPGGGRLDTLQRRNCYNNENHFIETNRKQDEYTYKGK